VTSRPSSIVVVALITTLAACSAAESALPSAEPSTQGPSAQGASTSVGSPSPAASGWAQLSSSETSPTPREDHTWTITPDGATGYLLGGRNGANVYDDLWAYSLATDAWQAVTPSGETPPARFGNNAGWAPGIGLVIFAGQGASAFFGDLWAYDPDSNAWRMLPAKGAAPVARYGSCGTIGPDGRFWISHGFTSDGQRFADTKAYDFETATWTPEPPVADAPIPPCRHASWWTDDGDMILYGGQTTGTTALGDRWRLTVGERPGTNAWTQLHSGVESPADRNLYASARWGSDTLVFGGQGLDGGYLADAWWLADDGSARPLDTGPDAPPARAGAELIGDEARGRLLLFGGRDDQAAFGDLWQLSLSPLP
jgi:hypothetical protein